MIDFLSIHRGVVLLILISAAVLNAFRFYGDWENFFGIMLIQFWLARGIIRSLLGGRSILPLARYWRMLIQNLEYFLFFLFFLFMCLSFFGDREKGRIQCPGRLTRPAGE